MPKMNGPEMVRQLQGVRPDLRVMFMSGYAGDVIERGGVESNVPVLEKPFTAHDLLQKVQELLDAQ
jgi:CheY-like chemotaxis protein